MDRQLEYANEILTEAELLTIQKNTLYGLGWTLSSMLGAGTFVDGLACTQTATPSLQVQVAPGVIYSDVTVDATGYSTLGTDTNTTKKQGLTLASQTLTLTAPATAGQSQNYLVQVAYSDVDTNNAVLSYYNSSNPAVPFSGPGNTGASQPTTRKGVCVVSLLAGTAATTGSQATPAPSSGYTGLYVITLAYGQTTITNSQIATLAGAPFITKRLGAATPVVPFFTGLGLSTDNSPTNTNLYVAVGAATVKLATNPLAVATATISSGLTKTFASFAAGSGNGALDTGTVASSTWYHAFLIYNPTTGASDVLVSLSATTPTLPSGFTYLCWIGAVKITSSGYIRWIKYEGDHAVYAGTPVPDNTGLVPASAPITVTLDVPTGLKFMADINVSMGNGTGGNVFGLIQSLDETGVNAAQATGATANIGVGPSVYTAGRLHIQTSTAGQVALSQSVSGGASFATCTVGFTRKRGI